MTAALRSSSGLFWGTLWFDTDGSLEERVKRAAEHYTKKTGKLPTVCMHPLQDVPENLCGLVMVYDKTVPKGCLWISAPE